MKHYDSHYRSLKLDYGSLLKNITDGLEAYLKKNDLRTMVIGISGGLDSTVSAAICKMVSVKTDIPLICVSLPSSTNKEDENDSAHSACNEFATQAIFYNIEKEYKVIKGACSSICPTNENPISDGNIKARLRMILIYDIASKTKGVTIDNDQLSENLLGFYTIHGDVFDINPIGSLWKTEVYGLAKYLLENVYKGSEALKRAIDITPTDGNVGGSDMDQIAPNLTYNEVDEILSTWALLSDKMKEIALSRGFGGMDTFERLFKKYGEDTVRSVIMRSVKSSFKRVHGPIVINAFTSKIEDKDGNTINY